MQPGMFRKAVLDRISSPEQLDLTMPLTSPLGWLALATIGIILLVAAVWSVLGSIPDLVEGEGVLLRGERLSEVKAVASGTLVKITVAPDSEVEADRVIAIITRDKTEIEQKLSLKKDQLARLLAEHAADDGADGVAVAGNQGLLAAKSGELASLRKQRRTQEELVNKGLKAGNVVFEFDRRINQVLGEIGGIEKENAAIRARMGPRRSEEANVAAEIQQLTNDLERTTTEIRSPEAGRVVEVIKSPDDKVREGEPLLRMEIRRGEGREASGQREFCGGRLHAVIFVPGVRAGNVRPGQAARVSPTDVKREEFGYIVGEVAWIANFAASPDDMREKLKNEKLVQSYNSQGPVFEARVCLTADPGNRFNGLRWSSSSGPHKKVNSGGLTTAALVVDERRPYTYVIPAVKRAMGL